MKALIGGVNESSNPAMTWCVSFVAGDNLADDRAHRATKTFAGEEEAKKLARAKYDAGNRTLVAGTINPGDPESRHCLGRDSRLARGNAQR